MPAPGFHAVGSDEPPLVSLEFLGGKEFRLLTSFRFVDTRAPTDWLVRAQGPGESTDLASSPPWLWGLAASYGRQLLPALLHDQRSKAAEAAYPTDPRRAYEERRAADLQLFRALLLQRVSLLRSAMFWSAVTFQRQLVLGRPVRGVVLGLGLLLSAVSSWGLVVGLLGVGGWVWAVGLFAAVLVLPLAQGRDYLAGLAGGVCAPVVLTVLAVNGVGNLALWVLELPPFLVRVTLALVRRRELPRFPRPAPTQLRGPF